MEKDYKRTTIFVIEPELWEFAKFKAKFKGYHSISHYLFDLMKKDLEPDLDTFKEFRGRKNE